MKNKKFQKLLNKNRSKSNSGFTLTELLVGIIMSGIVVGGLGWGLMQILTTTQKETSRVNSRNETSRAFSFISDEVKAAQTVEVDMSPGNITSVAPTFSAGGTVRLAINVPGVSERIIYSVAPQTGVFKGPRVIYRWGPNIGGDGSYTDSTTPNTWQNEALIDGVSDVDQNVTCDADRDGVAETFTYQGFYACVIDDDGDGVAIAAQLYFAADTDNGVYKTDSQVVARARVAPLRKPELNEMKLFEVEPLEAQFGRDDCWTVRTDFGQGSDPTALPSSDDALTNTLTWIYEPDRQPQPLSIDTSQPLTITASAFGGASDNCLARGNKQKRIWDSTNNEYRYIDSQGNAIDPGTDDESTREATDGSEELHTYEHKVWHTIDFSDPNTFNGSDSTLGTPSDVSRDAASNSPAEGQAGAGDVIIFKNGDRIDSSADYQGYDLDNANNVDGNRDQSSLEAFLQSKGYVDNSGQVTLAPNQRIIAFEIGQDVEGTDASPNPGFDVQDNIFIMTSDAFLSSDNSNEDGSDSGYDN